MSVLNANTAIKLHVDRVSIFRSPTSEMSVRGWCWCPEHQISGLSLELDGERTACLTGIERPDVAAHFGHPQARSAGFVGRIAVSKNCSSVQLTGIVNGNSKILADIAVPGPPEQHSRGREILTYSDWLQCCEARLFWREQEAPARIRGLRAAPEISILLPTYNTPRYYLERCIRSALRQHYPLWQLCIADDGSTDSETVSCLRQYAQRDARIVLELRPNCGGTSAASNTALRLATGEHIVLLDHDDELHPSALLEIVRCLNSSPEADLIYSDEDKIDNEGCRFGPSFKPAFDPELILAFNYIGHLVCVRRALMEQVRGFRPECDGSQDWDLLLRVIEETRPERIRHIPKPLYHWRSHPDSTAMSLAAKPHVHRAWRRVLGDHAKRVGKSADVREGLFTGSMYLRSDNSSTSVAAFYRTSDGPHQRRAIQRTGCSNLKLYEMTLSQLYPRDAASPRPLLTLSQLEGDVLVFLNAAVELLNHGFFDALMSCAMQADCGIAGALIVDRDNRIVNAGFNCRLDGTLINPFFGLHYVALGYMGLAKVPRAVAAIGAQCFAVRKSRLQSAGGLAILSEETLAGVCSKLVQSSHVDGLRVLYTPYAVMTIRRDATEERLEHIASPPGSALINPNIDAFLSPADFMRQGEAQ